MNAELLRGKVDKLCQQHAYDQIEAALLRYKDRGGVSVFMKRIIYGQK